MFCHNQHVRRHDLTCFLNIANVFNHANCEKLTIIGVTLTKFKRKTAAAYPNRFATFKIQLVFPEWSASKSDGKFGFSMLKNPPVRFF